MEVAARTLNAEKQQNVKGVQQAEEAKALMSDSLRPHGLWPTRLLSLWDFPGRIFAA